MTLTLTFALKIAFLDFVAAGGIVSVSQTHLDILPCGLDLDFDLLMEKLELVAAGVLVPLGQTPI